MPSRRVESDPWGVRVTSGSERSGVLEEMFDAQMGASTDVVRRVISESAIIGHESCRKEKKSQEM